MWWDKKESDMASHPRGSLLVGMLWFEEACRRASPVERPGVGFLRLFKPCCFVLLTRRWGRLDPRPPVALGSFPKFFAFAMTLAPPVPPCLIFLTDTGHCKIQCSSSKLMRRASSVSLGVEKSPSGCAQTAWCVAKYVSQKRYEYNDTNQRQTNQSQVQILLWKYPILPLAFLSVSKCEPQENKILKSPKNREIANDVDLYFFEYSQKRRRWQFHHQSLIHKKTAYENGHSWAKMSSNSAYMVQNTSTNLALSFPSPPEGSGIKSKKKGVILLGMLRFEEAWRRVPPVTKSGLGFSRLFKPQQAKKETPPGEGGVPIIKFVVTVFGWWQVDGLLWDNGTLRRHNSFCVHMCTCICV